LDRIIIFVKTKGNDTFLYLKKRREITKIGGLDQKNPN